MTHPLFERHRATIDNALSAIRARTYWSAYPETPSGRIYGETAKDDGQRAFEARLKSPLEIDQPGTVGMIGSEVSPYGMKLGITYPEVDLDALLAASSAAMESWKNANAQTRTGVCLEILHRLNKRSFEIAFAVMHTTGQGFMMAFQAGGPHAQDRGLEAVAYAYDEMSRIPTRVAWQKQVSKTEVVRLDKSFTLVPCGVGVVIGCSTFPTWNGYPGLFASLATGNSVVIKPHPGAILPLAITVEVAREVLKEQGFDPNLVTLAADTKAKPLTKKLVVHPAVKIVDYTGSSAFGNWIERHATQAEVFTEKAGVNSCIIDGIADLRAATGNLAFTLSLYSGQMCTTTQNIFIPRNGIDVAGEHKSFDEVAQAIVGAVNWFLGDPARAAEVLGAIQNDKTAKRIGAAATEGGTVLRASETLKHPTFPKARVRTPLIIKCDASDRKLYMREMFGPISYIIATDSTRQSIDLAKQCAMEHGGITWSAYSTSDDAVDSIEQAAIECGVPLSVNLTGQIWVNQSAAFSDYHVTGCNPSGNATLTDAAFVAGRFRTTQIRMPAAAPATTEVKPAAEAAVR